VNIENEQEKVEGDDKEISDDNNFEEHQSEYKIILFIFNSREKQNFKKSYIDKKIKESGLKEEILIGVNKELERNNQLIFDGILSNKYTMNRVCK